MTKAADQFVNAIGVQLHKASFFEIRKTNPRRILEAFEFCRFANLPRLD